MKLYAYRVGKSTTHVKKKSGMQTNCTYIQIYYLSTKCNTFFTCAYALFCLQAWKCHTLICLKFCATKTISSGFLRNLSKYFTENKKEIEEGLHLCDYQYVKGFWQRLLGRRFKQFLKKGSNEFNIPKNIYEVIKCCCETVDASRHTSRNMSV